VLQVISDMFTWEHVKPAALALPVSQMIGYAAAVLLPLLLQHLLHTAGPPRIGKAIVELLCCYMLLGHC
jgi:hypothetical protein